jgi:hypothetical protein
MLDYVRYLPLKKDDVCYPASRPLHEKLTADQVLMQGDPSGFLSVMRICHANAVAQVSPMDELYRGLFGRVVNGLPP